MKTIHNKPVDCNKAGSEIDLTSVSLLHAPCTSSFVGANVLSTGIYTASSPGASDLTMGTAPGSGEEQCMLD